MGGRGRKGAWTWPQTSKSLFSHNSSRTVLVPRRQTRITVSWDKGRGRSLSSVHRMLAPQIFLKLATRLGDSSVNNVSANKHQAYS